MTPESTLDSDTFHYTISAMEKKNHIRKEILHLHTLCRDHQQSVRIDSTNAARYGTDKTGSDEAHIRNRTRYRDLGYCHENPAVTPGKVASHIRPFWAPEDPVKFLRLRKKDSRTKKKKGRLFETVFQTLLKYRLLVWQYGYPIYFFSRVGDMSQKWPVIILSSSQWCSAAAFDELKKLKPGPSFFLEYWTNGKLIPFDIKPKKGEKFLWTANCVLATCQIEAQKPVNASCESSRFCFGGKARKWELGRELEKERINWELDR
ncbi:hypothetical protein V8F06_003899 [Rhypophila decipiens]